jgi:hypothetical protein
MTPKGSPEYENYETITALFPNTIEAVAVHVYGGTASQSQNIITKNAFTEMISLDAAIKSFKSKDGYQFTDFCYTNMDNNLCL